MSAEIAISFAWGKEGAENAADRGDIIVVVDALRATSTIVTALACGVRCVRPVALLSECRGELTAAEVDGSKHEGSDLDNSPLAFLGGAHLGAELVLRTSNGTQCVAAASRTSGKVVAGSLLNAASCGTYVAEKARLSERSVSFVLAGRKGEPAVEDGIAAVAIARTIGPFTAPVEFLVPPDRLEEAFLRSTTGEHLSVMGKGDDVRFCAQLDRFNVAPVLCGDFFTPEH